ncbi:branched-chain amino acid aminotransferase [Bacillus sp. KH172YL63]|uniref:branched-chain amino acid aminotransferase n=1 Tax=Bacillus sp. KH172YL63 TaxID=2709784 RepID=UPI0013E50A6D|nr:branched-chain amino acid aminotransferase [Bacillus sp. KH172YL63]BCB03835.1 hypothetical protein KH172YL63_19680 [Bacillus sp. KH172YL63]
MLKKRIAQYIEEQKAAQPKVTLFEPERGYALENGLISEGEVLSPESPRFEEAFIERCDKETEEPIRTETASFLDQPVTYLNEHKNEFVFLESVWFTVIGADAVSIEVDDVFGTYDAMLGLKLQKKHRKEIELFLEDTLQDESSYDLLFNGEDGLWDLNFTLNDHPGFNEGLSMHAVYELIFDFLFKLLQTVEEA